MAVSAAKFQSVTGFQGPVTAEVASSSLVVPASFFNNLQVGTFGIWVQLGRTRFGGFPCGQQMHRKNSLDQSRLGVLLRLRCRLQILVGHTEIAVTQVIAD